MKQFLICLFFLTLMPLLTLAQEDNSQAIYDGQPVMYIEGQEDVDKAAAFEPVPFTFGGEIDIKTPFGQKTTAAFVPQTTDFNTIVKILGNGDVVVEERLQLMNTDKKTIFNRTWPQIPGASFTLTNAQKDGKPVNLTFKQEQGTWAIEDKTPLSTGVHNYAITYLLKNALAHAQDIENLKLSLTGMGWPLPVERFSGVVLFPSKTTLTKQELLFGKNELVIPEAAVIQADRQGNMLYKLNRPLPALAEVTLDVGFQANALIKPSITDTIFEQMNHTLFWLCLLSLVIYAAATLAYLKYKKTKAVLKELSGYNLVSLHFIATHKTDTAFLKQLAAFYTYQKKRHTGLNTLIKIKKHLPKIGNGILKIYIWTNILRKYLLTMGVMIAIVTIQAANLGLTLSNLSVGILMGAAAALIIIIYIKGEKPYIVREIWAFERLTDNKNIGFGLSVTSLQALFIQFYPYTLAMGHEKDWINSLKPYNINLTAFTFLEQ